MRGLPAFVLLSPYASLCLVAYCFSTMLLGPSVSSRFLAAFGIFSLEWLGLGSSLLIACVPWSGRRTASGKFGAPLIGKILLQAANLALKCARAQQPEKYLKTPGQIWGAAVVPPPF